MNKYRKPLLLFCLLLVCVGGYGASNLRIRWAPLPVPYILAPFGSADFRGLLAQMEADAERWLISAVTDTGFIYSRNVVTGVIQPGNNPVRQLMAARLLAEIAHEKTDALALHRKTVTRLFDSWYRVSDSGEGYILFGGTSKLGSNAMALRTIVASPISSEFDTEARQLARGIQSMIGETGAMKPWFIEPNEAYDTLYLMTFYSGEAILALAEYAAKHGDAETLRSAVRAQNYYLNQYVHDIERNYYPAYVPWHIQSLSRLYELNRDPRYVTAVMLLADTLLALQDRKVFPGRFYDPRRPDFGNPHAASDGVYMEGLVYALSVARSSGDAKRASRYEKALALALSHLRDLQVSDAKEINPEDAGAIRVRHGSALTRVDATQHTLDGLRALRRLLENGSAAVPLRTR